jgi:hypothetical protein
MEGLARLEDGDLQCETIRKERSGARMHRCSSEARISIKGVERIIVWEGFSGFTY